MIINQDGIKFAAEYHENERSNQENESYCFTHSASNCKCAVLTRKFVMNSIKKQYEKANEHIDSEKY